MAIVLTKKLNETKVTDDGTRLELIGYQVLVRQTAYDDYRLSGLLGSKSTCKAYITCQCKRHVPGIGVRVDDDSRKKYYVVKVWAENVETKL